MLLAVDGIAPVIACLDDITETTNLNSPGTIVTFSEPTATDNSGSVSLSSRSHAPGQFFVTGSTTVTYTFVDPSGNSASCSFNVIVIEGKSNCSYTIRTPSVG